ncbi:MAG: CRISPR-associated endonuclease Cas2 [Sphingorhabdus sp.]
MSQFSIYARFCNGKEQLETYLRRIRSNIPESGDIHVLSFTAKQYENIVRFSNQSRQGRVNRICSCCQWHLKATPIIELEFVAFYRTTIMRCFYR